MTFWRRLRLRTELQHLATRLAPRTPPQAAGLYTELK